MAYDVGTIEATLKANLDDTDFRKFDAAVAKAKSSTQELAASQGKAATEMRLSGKSYDDIARKMNLTEKEVKDLIRRNQELGASQRTASASTGRFGDATHSATDKVKQAAKALIGLAVAYGGLRAMKKAIDDTQELGLATIGLRRNLGLTTKEASKWAAVAKARGTDSKALTLAFTTLSRNLEGVADGNQTAIDTFQKLGVSQEDLKKKQGDFSGQVTLLAEAFGEAEGSTTRQAAAQKLLGRGYQSLLPMFADGAKGLKDQLEWADKYHLTFGEKLTGDVGEMTSAQRESRVAFMALEKQFARGTLPMVTEAHREFQKFVRVLSDPKLTDGQKMGRISRQVNGIVDKIMDTLMDAAPKIAERGGRLGLAIAKGTVQTFLKSDWLGKLAIGTWLVHKMGGFGAIARLGGRVGLRLAKALGVRFLAAVAPYFAADVAADGLGGAIAARTPGLSKSAGGLGRTMGRAFGTAFLAGAIAFGFTKVRDYMNQQAGGAQDNWDKVGGPPINPAQEKARSWAGSAWDWAKGHSGGMLGGFTGGLVTGEGIKGYARGGEVRDPRDTVPAMLAPGEFVLRKRAVDKVGVPFLRDLNNTGEVRKEAKDGADEITGTYDKIEKKLDKSTEKTEKTVTDRFKSIRKTTVKEQGRVERGLRDSWKKIDQDHSDRVRSMDQATSRRFGGMRKTVAARGREMVGSMGKTMGSLQDSVFSGFDSIASQTNRALRAFGVQPVSFGTRTASGDGGNNHAGGGFIAGSGKRDTVPLVLGMAAPGEAILNGAQQAEVEQSLAMTRAMGMGQYGSLDDLFAGVTTPHYAYARGGRLQWPTRSHPITSGFGARSSPGGVGSTNHDGIDIGVGTGTPVYAAGPGSVTAAGPNGGYGNYVAVQHPGGVLSFYGHLLRWMVRAGQQVQAGQQIALSDNTGASTGPHLHFGTHVNGVAVDPLSLLGAGGSYSGPVAAQLVKALQLTGPDGALKSGGQGALDKVRKAANKFIRRKTANHDGVAGFGNVQPSGDFQAMGRQMMLTMWPVSEWPALLELWNRESGWNPGARNPSSGAYGIPQALPASKMGAAAQGSDAAAARAQIAWGLRYIKDRYGSPSAALAFHDGHNWYAHGGRIPGFAGGGKLRQLWRGTAIDRTFPANDGYHGKVLRPNVIQALAESFGLPGKTMFQITKGESMGRPGMDENDPPGRARGLYAINSAYHPGSSEYLRNPINNTKEAARIARAAGGPNANIWHGSGHVTGWNLHFPGGEAAIRQVIRSVGGNPDGEASPRLPKRIWIPNEDGQGGRWITRTDEPADRKQRERARHRRKVWARRRRDLMAKRRAAVKRYRARHWDRREGPRISRARLRETIGFDDPLTGDVSAYRGGFDFLERIDPQLRVLRERLTRTFDLGEEFGGQTLRERYQMVDHLSQREAREIREMRGRLGRLKDRDLERRRVAWAGKGKGHFDPSAKGSRPTTNAEIRRLYDREINRRATAIRRRFSARSRRVMHPVERERQAIERRFSGLIESGSAMRGVVADTRRTIRQARLASTSQSGAFQFARGGRVGSQVLAAGGSGAPPIVLNVEITDPVLSALNPQIDVRIGQIGKKVAARGRAGGGMKARL